MAETVIISSVILIFLLILIQDISIRFLYEDKFFTEIDYSFFTITLGKKKKRKKLGKISPKLFLPIKRTAEFLLCRSDVKISKIKLKTEESDPRKFGIRYRNAFSLFSALTVYLTKKTKKLTVNDDSIVIFTDPEEKNKFLFDVSITAPLYLTLITAAKFLLILSKNKKLVKMQSENKNA
ncbi:MAG: hypothetical protein IJW38_02190 [Clostridia bacterium]|nr:hypothetical protein [Clostridia bacterium]